MAGRLPSLADSGGSASPQEYLAFRQFLQQVCGIYLAEGKEYLVETRLRRVLVRHRLASLVDLLERIRQPRFVELRNEVIETMTTNETYWFRDRYPFELLRQQILPDLLADSAAGPVRIWSAACSSGQEAYSISMVADACSRPGRTVEITATDLSQRVLAQARRGEYDRLAMARGLSAEQRQLYFQPLASGELWQVREAVRRRVTYRAHNLLDSFAPLGMFDVIFCRNVLIYFDTARKLDILRRLHAALRPGGILFLGASEGNAGVADLFKMVYSGAGIYYRAL